MKTPILDEPEKIKAVDKSNMINFSLDAPKLYYEAAKLAQKIQVNYSQTKQHHCCWNGWLSNRRRPAEGLGKKQSRLYPLKLTVNTSFLHTQAREALC